jgi:hypothetical protein
MSPNEACMDTLKRVARNYGNDRERLKKIGLFFSALRKDGEYGAASLWSKRDRDGKMVPAQFVVNDGSGSRHADAVFLFESA